MTPQQASAGMQRFVNYVQSQFERDILVVGSMALSAAIRNRVEQTGIAADGSKFTPYSTKPMLAGAKTFTGVTAFNRIAGTKEKRAALEWVTVSRGGTTYRLFVIPNGYKQVRELEGRQVAHKSFNRTGFMWQGFGIKGAQNKRVVIGGKSQDSQNKINWNSAREKQNIIEASDRETEVLAAYITNKLTEKLNDFIGN